MNIGALLEFILFVTDNRQQFNFVVSSVIRYGVHHMDILCRRVNGNISSIETYSVELMSRIKLSIEGRLNE